MTKKRFRTYVWLRRFVVRGNLRASPVNVYNLYYMEGRLATSYPLSRIAKDLNISKATAGDHINQLEKDGVIVVDEVPPDETKDKHAHRVYILGAHSKGQESWFIDDVFKPGT
ncbi:MAG: winged helix-turn-helix domain-containing protein [Desulfobacterales bacterium]|nr:winged helix-turn-helix domain-containing protein [Desulfobacterales bacterium]